VRDKAALAGIVAVQVAQPPQRPCPITTTCLTSRNWTANSSAADTPWRPGVVS
jgi:hypothetical protein